MQAFLTGHLIGLVAMEAGKYRAGEGIMKITDVRPAIDKDGNYENTFMVTFESGLSLSVSVNESTEIPESP
jgi:hypothetical protein